MIGFLHVENAGWHSMIDALPPIINQARIISVTFNLSTTTLDCFYRNGSVGCAMDNPKWKFPKPLTSFREQPPQMTPFLLQYGRDRSYEHPLFHISPDSCLKHKHGWCHKNNAASPIKHIHPTFLGLQTPPGF